MSKIKKESAAAFARRLFREGKTRGQVRTALNKKMRGSTMNSRNQTLTHAAKAVDLERSE